MKRYFSALDIGSNSFHLIICELQEDGTFCVVHREREVLRVGTSVDDTTGKHFITDSEIEKSIELIQFFNKICNQFNTQPAAVATSAIREAVNSDEFAKRIYDSTNIKIEVIDGRREAELIYKGIDHSLKIENKKLLCVDIGGGSAEITIGLNGNVLFSKSIKAGAVRLTNMFFQNAELTEQGIQKCRGYIYELLKPLQETIIKTGYDIAVGSSGTAQTAYTLISASKGGAIERINNVVFTKEDLLKIKEHVFFISRSG